MHAVHLAISVFGLANGFTCSLFLFLNRGKHRQANTYLACVLLILTGLQAYIALMAGLETERGQSPWLHLLLQNDLLIAPYWYAFVYTWLANAKYKLSLIHHTPFILEKCCRLLLVIYSSQTTAHWTSNIFNVVDGLWQLAAVGIMVLYFIKCMLLLRLHQTETFECLSYGAHYDMAWLKHTHYLILAIILIFGSMSLIDGIVYNFRWTELNYWPVTICISIMMVWLSLKSYKSDFSSIRIASIKSVKVPDNALVEQAKLLQQQVLMGTYYLDPDLDLAKLALCLHLNKGQLSKLINEGLGLSFSDFINQMRVDHFKAKLKEPQKWEHLNLMGMAYESGFASKATFNRVFKSLTGKTPKEYKDTITNY